MTVFKHCRITVAEFFDPHAGRHIALHSNFYCITACDDALSKDVDNVCCPFDVPSSARSAQDFLQRACSLSSHPAIF